MDSKTWNNNNPLQRAGALYITACYKKKKKKKAFISSEEAEKGQCFSRKCQQ